MATKKKTGLDSRQLWQLERIGGLAIAPDGTQAVCAVTGYDIDKNKGSTALWLLSTLGGAPRRLTRCGERDGQPAWSPRGDRIAFVAKRGQGEAADKAPQLYAIAPDGGEATRLTTFGPGVSAFKWLPDGRRIVFTAWVWPQLKTAAAQNKQAKSWRERKESGYATSDAYYRYWDHNVPQDRVLRPLLLDTGTGRITDLFAGTKLELPRHDGGNGDFDVSPDGRHLAFVHDPAAEPKLGNPLVLSEIDLRTRRVRTLVNDAAWDFAAPRYSPDGRHIACTAAEVGRVHTALAHVALVERRSGSWQALRTDWDLDVSGPLGWSADGASIAFTAEERGRCHLWSLDIASGVIARLHEGGTVLGFDRAGDTVVLAADSALHPARVWVRRGSAPPQRIEHFNDTLLAQVQFGEVREIEVRGAGGDPVQAWITFPPGFKPTRRHPVTQVIHGGPYAAAGDTFGWRWNPHVFAGMGKAGHVIVQVNFHGSSGFGHAFRHSLVGRQGELELQDIEAATDWVRRQPWADKERVFATGGSYGGFLVAWMNGHVKPGRYQAYVCHAGVFDRVATFSADSWPQRPKDLAANWWQDMPRVHAQSPHASAAAMHTPTLVIHGALDYRVPDCNGLAYYNTLKARGVDARLLWFPDENHWVLKPANSLLWYREFAGWLARFGG
jgi:dipeptidyl aminopeptidase/acylaminoacyl peptidase